MKPRPGSRPRRGSLILVALFSLFLVVLTVHTVPAQGELDLTSTFDYSPLVAGATNTVDLVISNTVLAPVRLLWVGLRFSWMKADAYLPAGGYLTLAVQQKVHYNVSLQKMATIRYCK